MLRTESNAHANLHIYRLAQALKGRDAGLGGEQLGIDDFLVFQLHKTLCG